jgi:hypothetical protein
VVPCALVKGERDTAGPSAAVGMTKFSVATYLKLG